MPKLVYILAASHSGSTLTVLLLNTHPQICTAGELKATHLGNADSYRCSCGELISQCDFWEKVKLSMATSGLDFDIRHAQTSLSEIPSRYVQRTLKPLVRGPFVEKLRDALLWASPTWRRYFVLWKRRNLALIDSVAKFGGAKHVADSSKIAIRLKYLKTLSLDDIKVIRVIRDGRAVALTYMKPAHFADATDPELRGGGSGSNSRDIFAHSMITAAREWRRSNEEAEQILKTIPAGDQVCITYEQLCTNTDETMNKIFRFLGLPESENHKNFRAVPHHIVGNGMRLDSGSEVKLDERWRQVLGSGELAEFERVAGDLNRSYGYK
jgi:hypothetical protein